MAVSYSCRLNGIDQIALTKSDVLDGLEEIMVCVGYNYKGERLPSFPTESWILEKVVPQYKKVRGWKEPIQKIKDFSALPGAFKDYIKLIEDSVEARIAVVSTGMERGDTILIQDELKGLVDLDKVMSEL